MSVVARGSEARLSGGSLPVAVVQPGVVNTAVSVAAAPQGLYYVPDPSSQPVCTLCDCMQVLRHAYNTP